MARPRKKPLEVEEVKKANLLLDALKFIASAQKDIGDPTKCFCQLTKGFVLASDGILTACCPIDEDLEARPHTKKLIAALENCGKNLSITQLDKKSIVVKSGNFSANIPCYEDEALVCVPDESIAIINNNIRTGFSSISHLVLEQAQTVIQSSIQLKAHSMVSTNSVVLLEYWHGIDLPTINIPKSFINAICNTSKNLVKAGFSQSSVTFYFDDNSWIKSQIFAEPWPQINHLFDNSESPIALPSNFWEAIRCVEDFSEYGKEKGSVFLNENGISSHQNQSEGAFYALPGLKPFCLNIKHLKSIQGSCQTIYFAEKQAWFYGGNVRGTIMGMKF